VTSPLAPGTDRAAAGHVPHVHQSAYETGYFVIAVSFVAMLLLTNIIGTKLFVFPLDFPVLGWVLTGVDRIIQAVLPGQGGGDSLTLTAGIITYPLTFLFTDIVSEVYGRKRADRMVLLGFATSLLMLGVIAVARALPPSPIWNIPAGFADVLAPARLVATPDGSMVGDATAAQAAYQFTFDAPGVLLFASMTAYLVAQLVDNRLFHFWRRLTGGRWLWFRNNASTGLSQLVDTIIVNSIFLHFYWELPAAAIAAIILASYAVKAMFAALDTPFCYLGVGLTRRLVGGPTAS